ncbi:toprim domain-containing protein [Microvirga ossetica]|uniref:toprim domain-containing protein n=1 Tax=Microvirga ossetica TaxID=1882682 RepID=UPI000C14D18A|nr:toprim domain-containing protein [Microvirga ossetica]
MSDTRPSIDFAAIARSCLDRGERLVRSWLPGGRREGHEWVARNPVRADRKAGSFKVNLRTGKWSEFATGDKGGDLVSLYAYLHGLSQVNAARDLAAKQGPETRTRARMPKPAQSPVPVHASRPEDGSSAFAQTLWTEGVDSKSTLAEAYLTSRGHSLIDDMRLRLVRFHPACPFGKDGDGRTIRVPALLIAFRPPRGDSGEREPPQAIHRVGLRPDGSKIGKMMLGPVGGLVMMVSPDETVGDGLFVTEGFEDALAARALGLRPVWALGSTSGLVSLDVLPGITSLTVLADRDPNGAGVEAARACRARWQSEGCEVRIIPPAEGAKDWCDVFVKRGPHA